jgi:hypothetical protein
VNATSEGAARLTRFATGGGDQQALLDSMASRQPDGRWHDLADAIMRDRLADVVPADLQHQQAARAELVNAMAHEGWNEPSANHAEAATESIQGAEAATTRIRDHYALHSHPYPAAEPSHNAPAFPLEEALERASSPEPAAPTSTSAKTESDRVLRAAFSGQAQPQRTRSRQPLHTDSADVPRSSPAHNRTSRGLDGRT